MQPGGFTIFYGYRINLNIEVVIKLGFQLSIIVYSNLIIAKVFKEINIFSA